LAIDLRLAVACLAVVALGSACLESEGALLRTADKEDKSKKTVSRTCLDGGEFPSKMDEKAPAVAVKVENDPAARPQSGLEKADVVYEEIVEGGITRFMAIFHCGDSKKVGPIRSARFDDPKIALPFTNTLAYSGANSIVQKELRKRRVMSITEGMKGAPLFRSPAGSISVHSVHADTKVLRKYVPKKATPPAFEVFSRGDTPDGAKSAKRVKVNFEAGNTIEYVYKKGLWYRWEAGSKFMAASGKQIAVPNLLVQEVRVDNSRKIVDIEGNPSPDIDLEGKGRALLFRDGKVVRGEWKIKKDGKPPVFTTNKGDAMTFAEGPIWVELVPSRKGSVKGAIAFK
jgi:Protein of unknown function (DUF3048) N-terminal domain/Protein of unknown function (DUF3048) C-terminal domain